MSGSMAGHAGRRQARCEPSGASPAWCSIKRRAGSDPAPAGGGLQHAGSGRSNTSKATSRATAKMNRAAPPQRLRMLLVGDWHGALHARPGLPIGLRCAGAVATGWRGAGAKRGASRYEEFSMVGTPHLSHFLPGSGRGSTLGKAAGLRGFAGQNCVGWSSSPTLE